MMPPTILSFHRNIRDVLGVSLLSKKFKGCSTSLVSSARSAMAC